MDENTAPALTPEPADRANIRGLTLWQPWASLMALGWKAFETRSWSTDYRGVVAIHAAKNIPAEYREAVESLLKDDDFRNALSGSRKPITRLDELPSGCIVGLGRLVGCHKASMTTRAMVEGGRGKTELKFGDFTDGRFLHEYEDLTLLPKPVPCRGAQQFWSVSNETIREMALQFRGATHRMHRDYRRWFDPVLTREPAQEPAKEGCNPVSAR